MRNPLPDLPKLRGVTSNGDFIRERRRSIGWTQEELAAEAQCSERTIRYAEAGARLDMPTLRRISSALGASYDDVAKVAGLG